MIKILLATALALAPAGVALSQEADATDRLTYAIADTGQDRCFGSRSETAFPDEGQAFFGQDAQYETNAPRYQDNGDGTVSDLTTGLIWQKAPAAQKYDQAGAEAYAKDLRFAGSSDWRLPTIKELFSIADFRGNMRTRTPYIDTDAFDFVYPDSAQGESGRPGERNMDAQYCSSTVYLGITMGRDQSAFGFNFADGRIKSYPLHAARYVRCVRGNKDYGKNRFKDNRDGTVTDRASGLTWQTADSGKAMDWKGALAHAESLEFAGHDDWRLPNVKELQSIVDYSRAPDAAKRSQQGPAIDRIFKLTEDESWFWTSTTHIENQGAYYVCFGQSFSARVQNGKQINAHGAGAVRSDPKEGNPADWPDGLGPQADEIRILNMVRCVRGGSVRMIEQGPAVAQAAPGTGPGAPEGSRGPRNSGSNRFIDRLDADGDGKVSKDEFDGPDRGFGRRDTNGDGFIDASETPQGRRRQGSDGEGNSPRNARRGQTQSSQLEVVTVGTGSPLYNPDRSSPCTMIRFGSSVIVVDMGEGTALQMQEDSFRLNSIAAFCFTHHHRDHNADAMTLLPMAWQRGVEGPIIGPKGTKDLTDFLWDFYAEDLLYRTRKKEASSAPLAAPKPMELPLSGPTEIAGVTITASAVHHSIETWAFRFEAGGKSIVVSGDLTYSDSLIKLAQGADIMVMDSGGIVYEGDDERRGRSRSQSEPKDQGGKSDHAHASLEEVAHMAAKSKVDKLVLTHFRPGTVDEAATLKRMSAIYKGEIVFASDMQVHR